MSHFMIAVKDDTTGESVDFIFVREQAALAFEACCGMCQDFGQACEFADESGVQPVGWLRPSQRERVLAKYAAWAHEVHFPQARVLQAA